MFAARAQELLRDGDFKGALEAAENAVDLEPANASNQVVRGNALQVLMRLEDAKKAYARTDRHLLFTPSARFFQPGRGSVEGSEDSFLSTDEHPVMPEATISGFIGVTQH